MELFKKELKYSGIVVTGIIGIASILLFQGYYVKSTYEKIAQQTFQHLENMLSSTLLKQEIQSLENKQLPDKANLPGIPDDKKKQNHGQNSGGASIKVVVLGQDTSRRLEKTLDSQLKAISSRFGQLSDTELYTSLSRAMEEEHPELQFTLLIKKNNKFTTLPGKVNPEQLYRGPSVSPIFNKRITYTLLLDGMPGYIIHKMWVTIFYSFVVAILSIGAILLLGKNLRENRKLLSFKKGFMRNMAHELKTPLSTLLATSELLTNEKILDNKDRTTKYISYIRAELFRLSDMVEEILTNSQLEEQKISLNKQQLPIFDTIQKAIDRYSSSFNRENDAKISPPNIRSIPYPHPLQETERSQGKISLSLDIPSNLYMFADPVHMENVFGNLIENAIKYKSEQQLSYLKISAIRKKKHISIKFEDNGIGVDNNYLNKIFEPFFRVPESRIELIKGYGLGLSYVKEIMDLHKGSITVRNNNPLGCIFEINMPDEGS
ncbi:sensor histidine kinase [Pedobacter sp. AW31-3R]|uniref:sensor histidine kinase n=1 Tax=Pedobacter sp. AW31-3R TaxID=3445781 RepID=UPI003F9EE0DF